VADSYPPAGGQGFNFRRKSDKLLSRYKKAP